MTSKFAGPLIFGMICLSILHDIAGGEQGAFLYLLAGISSWLAALLLLPTLGKIQLLQAGVIAGVGLLLLMLAWTAGGSLNISSVVSKNASLVAMIASVGFLRLITLTGGADKQLPTGPGAYFKTLFGVSLFATVINISAPILFADRLYAENKLTRFASTSITRVFSGCSGWSPFFGGMAAILTYVPEVSLLVVMAACLPFTLVGLLVVCLEAWYRKRRLVDDFSGYPVRFNSLWIPVSLSLLVMSISALAPHWSILTSISLASLLLTITVLVTRVGMQGFKVVKQHIDNQLPRMINELLLFLVAGVLAQGLASIVSTGQLSVPAFQFGVIEAVLLLTVMIVISAVGVHPVVVVAGVTPLLLTMDPAPNLLAIVYLLAWSLGTCASPLSGTHLVFQGRYGIPSWRGALWNWPYVGVMLLLAFPFLALVNMVV
ncbi:MAG: hypothetical protein AAF404_09210 [Pseudomonadota bacterium]